MEDKCLLESDFRAYVMKTQEIFELLDSKTNTAIRWVFHYGESLPFFVEDWEKEDGRIIKQIIDHIGQEASATRSLVKS